MSEFSTYIMQCFNSDLMMRVLFWQAFACLLAGIAGYCAARTVDSYRRGLDAHKRVEKAWDRWDHKRDSE